MASIITVAFPDDVTWRTDPDEVDTAGYIDETTTDNCEEITEEDTSCWTVESSKSSVPRYVLCEAGNRLIQQEYYSNKHNVYSSSFYSNSNHGIHY